MASNQTAMHNKKIKQNQRELIRRERISKRIMFNGRTKRQLKIIRAWYCQESSWKKGSQYGEFFLTNLYRKVIITDGYREKTSDRIMSIIEKVTAIGRVTTIRYRLAIRCNLYIREVPDLHFTDRITYRQSVKLIRNLEFRASFAQLYVNIWRTLW